MNNLVTSVLDNALEFDEWLAHRKIATLTHRQDLFLVFQCGQRHEQAWRDVLERLQQRQWTIAKFSSDPGFPSEIVASTLFRLSEPLASGQQRISSYQGTSPLSAWLTAVLVREAIDALRRQGPHQKIEPAAIDGASLAVTQLARSQLAPMVHQATLAALQLLTVKQRTLLHYRFVDKVSIAKLATLLGVHRVTISRMLAEIHAQLNSEIRAGLVRDHNIPTAEISTMVRSVLSQLEGSLESLGKPPSATVTNDVG